jgi:hypothetical protein
MVILSVAKVRNICYISYSALAAGGAVGFSKMTNSQDNYFRGFNPFSLNLIKGNQSGLSKRLISGKLATLSITLPQTNPRTRSYKEAKSQLVIVLRESVNKLRNINPLTLATTFKTNKG